MSELFQAAIALINLPFTIMLGLIVFYWIMVIFGALDMDMFHVDIDSDADVDIDSDADMDVDGTGGLFHSVLHFLHVGELPVMLIVSIMILCAWCISILGNHYLNPGTSLWIAAGLLIPNITISLLISGFFTRPLARLFRSLDDDISVQQILYKTAIVTTSEVTPQFGQAEIQTMGPPITINVRSQEGVVLKKGDPVIIYDEDKDKGVYFVEKFNDDMEKES